MFSILNRFKKYTSKQTSVTNRLVTNNDIYDSKNHEAVNESNKPNPNLQVNVI